MAAPGDPALGQRKARDRAIVVPLAGLILLVPPLAGIFDVPAQVAGVPVALAYVFAVWLALIAGAAAAARRLRDTDEAGPLAGPPPPDG